MRQITKEKKTDPLYCYDVIITLRSQQNPISIIMYLFTQSKPCLYVNFDFCLLTSFCILQTAEIHKNLCPIQQRLDQGKNL